MTALLHNVGVIYSNLTIEFSEDHCTPPKKCILQRAITCCIRFEVTAAVNTKTPPFCFLIMLFQRPVSTVTEKHDWAAYCLCVRVCVCVCVQALRWPGFEGVVL